MSHLQPLHNFVSGCESSTPGCEQSSPGLPTGGKGSRSQPEHPRGPQEGSAGSTRLVEGLLRPLRPLSKDPTEQLSHWDPQQRPS